MDRIKCRLDWLRGLDNAYAEAVKRGETNNTIKTQATNSFLAAAIPRQVLRECRSTDFTSFPRVLERPVMSFFSAAATVPCELANRSGRRVQNRAADHCRLSAERAWMAPYKDFTPFFASFVSPSQKPSQRPSQKPSHKLSQTNLCRDLRKYPRNDVRKIPSQIPSRIPSQIPSQKPSRKHSQRPAGALRIRSCLGIYIVFFKL